MATRKLTIRLPEEDIDFAKEYAARHGLTMTELIDRYLKKLQRPPDRDLSPEILRFSGIIPETAEPREDYYAAVEEKHK